MTHHRIVLSLIAALLMFGACLARAGDHIVTLTGVEIFADGTTDIVIATGGFSPSCAFFTEPLTWD